MTPRRGGARPGAGRKPLSVEVRLRNRVMVSFADSEYDELVDAAGPEALSAFIRRIVLRSLVQRRRRSPGSETIRAGETRQRRTR